MAKASITGQIHPWSAPTGVSSYVKPRTGFKQQLLFLLKPGVKRTDTVDVWESMAQNVQRYLSPCKLRGAGYLGEPGVVSPLIFIQYCVLGLCR